MSTITVSCRQKPTSVNMLQWLSQYNLYTSIEEITGVFGFVQEYSPLYGGRIYYGAEITEEDLVFLQDKGLSLKLTLTSRIVSKKDYLDSREMLNKYYYHGNTIAAVNDNLARWIKRDFPNYIVEASVIKNIGWGDIEATLEIYDTIVLTMDKNDDLENLSKIKDKERIIYPPTLYFLSH